MQRVQPSLIVGRWLPMSYDVITILPEFQMQTERIGGTTADTVISGLVQPWVLNLFHHILAKSNGCKDKHFRRKYQVFALKI